MFRPAPILPRLAAMVGLVSSLVLGLLLQPAPARAQKASSMTRPSPRVVNDRAAAVQRLLGERAAWVEAKRGLSSRYRQQLAEIDALKRRPSGWRRNRQLREAYARTQQSARRLAEIDRRLRVYNRRITILRKQLVSAIDAELAATPAPSRASALRRLRGEHTSSRRRRARRIKLPSDRIDPLASAEELEEQAELLEQSEAELAREIANLEKREARLRKMAKLRRTARRASEMDLLDNNNPRRTTGRVGGAGSGAGADVQSEPDQGAGAPEAGAPPPSDDFGGGGGTGGGDRGTDGGGVTTDFSIVLADVVDDSTLNAYRSADRSGDPRRRAEAARRLRREAEQRLTRLRAQRRRMIDLARKRRR